MIDCAISRSVEPAQCVFWRIRELVSKWKKSREILAPNFIVHNAVVAGVEINNTSIDEASSGDYITKNYADTVGDGNPTPKAIWESQKARAFPTMEGSLFSMTDHAVIARRILVISAIS